MTAEGIWIFLDYSNMWIEAKKVKGSSLIRAFSEEPRLRIDIEGLENIIGNGRVVNKKTLYGSELTVDDLVQKDAEEKGWTHKIRKSSPHTGREKIVDTQIVADVTELACDHPNPSPECTVVIVSGDTDMSPGIEKAIERNWNVEVWAMKGNMGAFLERLRNEHPELMKTLYLTPEQLETFTFINEKCNIGYLDRDDLLQRGIVLRQWKPKTEEIVQELREILNKFKWPWQYDWQPSTMSQDLVIVFLKCSDETLKFKLQHYTKELKRQCQSKLCDSVLTYFEYKKTQRKAPGVPVSNRYTPLELENEESNPTGEGPSSTTKRRSPSPPKDSWQQVKSKKSKKH